MDGVQVGGPTWPLADEENTNEKGLGNYCTGGRPIGLPREHVGDEPASGCCLDAGRRADDDSRERRVSTAPGLRPIGKAGLPGHERYELLLISAR